jgi:hypothetical protein
MGVEVATERLLQDRIEVLEPALLHEGVRLVEQAVRKAGLDGRHGLRHRVLLA